MANARLGWFSPLGLAASIRASAQRVGASAFRFGDGRRASWPSGSRLPLFGLHRFGVALGGLVLPPGGLAFGLTASAFRHAPLRSGRWASWPSGSPLPLFGTHRFGDCRRAGWPSGSLLPLFGMHRFGVAVRRVVLRASASAFRHAPLRNGRWTSSFFRLPFRRWLPGGLAFGLTASAFRHAPLRGCRSAGWFFHLPLRRLPSAGWPSGSLLPLFGMRRSAPPRRRREDRRSTPIRHLFHFKTLIPTC